MNRQLLISRCVFHSIYGFGKIVDFQMIAYHECVGISFKTLENNKYFVFPYCFFFMAHFISSRNDDIREDIQNGFFIGEKGYYIEYSTLSSVHLFCHNCKRRFIYKKQDRIANIKKNTLPPWYCPECKEKMEHSNIGEIINAMWHDNPRRMKKPWWFHNTDGMHIEMD